MMTDARRAKLETSRLVTLVGIHLALDLALTRNGWFWDQRMMMVVLAIPLSQLALLTIWAVVVATSPLLRLVVPTISTVACWYLQSLILPWGVGEEATAAWAIGLVIQVFTIFAACECYRLHRNVRAAKNEKHPNIGRANSLNFGLGTLMLWTTVVGLIFGFVQFGRRSWQWTAAVLQWDNLAALPIIGVTNGLVAAICLWAFATGRLTFLIARMLTAAALAGGFALFQCYAIKWLTGAFAMTLQESLIVVAAQFVVISVSLSFAIAKMP